MCAAFCIDPKISPTLQPLPVLGLPDQHTAPDGHPCSCPWFAGFRSSTSLSCCELSPSTSFVEHSPTAVLLLLRKTLSLLLMQPWRPPDVPEVAEHLPPSVLSFFLCPFSFLPPFHVEGKPRASPKLSNTPSSYCVLKLSLMFFLCVWCVRACTCMWMYVGAHLCGG